MYNVSNDVIEAYKGDGVHKEFRVVIGNTSYGNEYIVDDSFNLKQSFLDSESFEAIGCIASSFSVELRAQFRTKIRNKKVKVFVKTDDTSEIQLFEGYVNKCTKTANGWQRSIEAYDYLYSLSGQSGQVYEGSTNKYDITEWFNDHNETTIRNLLDQLCFKFNLDIKEGNMPLVNGSVNTKCGKENKASSLSALDLLKYIMQINGCFGYITGDGDFSWKYLKTHTYDDTGWLYPSAYLFPSSTLYPGQDQSKVQTKENATNFIGEYETLEYQDFQMLPIGFVKIRNYEKDMESGNYGRGSAKNTYIIQGNVLVLGSTKEEKDKMAKNIFDVLNSTWYVPFSSKLQGLPYLECGDEINFWDFVGDYGQAHLQRFYILSRTLTGGQHLVDEYTAQGNEYLREFITGSGNDSGIRDELEENYDTSETVDEKINQAAGLYRIVSITPSEIPENPDPHTLYCIQGECVFVDELPEYDPNSSESPDIPDPYPDPEEPDTPEEPTDPETPEEPETQEET